MPALPRLRYQQNGSGHPSPELTLPLESTGARKGHKLLPVMRSGSALVGRFCGLLHAAVAVVSRTTENSDLAFSLVRGPAAAVESLFNPLLVTFAVAAGINWARCLFRAR